MKEKYLTVIASFLILASVGMVSASATPSTNEENINKSWAHVNVLDVRIGEIDLEFVSTRAFASCFEYRTDGDTSQMSGSPNYNPAVTDGLYPFICVNNQVKNITLDADEYVEVRMVFGAEADERFDWTRFDVLSEPTKAEVLMEKGAKGKGIANAPGLQKTVPNENFAKGLMM